MKKSFSLFSLIFLIFISNSCKKNIDSVAFFDNATNDTLTAKQKLSLQIFGNTDFKFNKNDSIYLTGLKKFSKNFKLSGKGSIEKNNRILTCSLIDGDSTFGWYSDPDTLLLDGPYSSSKNFTYESIAENCSDLQLTADDANQYLINEGYSDIAESYYTWPTKRFRVIHAANALIEFKSEFILEAARISVQNSQAKLANCLFQALGFAALSELGANWANASRQYIIKAVGKLASKYLNWFGAAIAVVSFIDCMWG